MAAPTFVADYEGASWDTTTSPQTSGAITASAGHVLVSGTVDETDANNENYTWSDAAGNTWTEHTETSGTVNVDVFVQTAASVLTTGLTAGTVSLARTAGDVQKYGLSVGYFTGSDGIGATARNVTAGSATASLSVTTLFDNSALFVIFGDWAAVDGASRTWLTVNGFTPTAGNGQELTYFRNAANYTLYVAYYPDAGTAGSKTVGLSAPGAADFMGAVVEVRGSGVAAPVATGRRRVLNHPGRGPGPTNLGRFYRRPRAFPSTAAPVVTGLADATLGGSATALGLPTKLGQAAASLGGSATAAGVPTTLGVAAATLGGSATALGIDRALGQATASLGGTFTALGVAGTPPVTGQATASLGGSFTAAGIPRTSGTAAAPFGGTATAAGVPRTSGAALSPLGGSFTALGRPRHVGQALAALGGSAVVTGLRRTWGQATALLGGTATASGVVGSPPVTGQATATLGGTATAAGIDRALGQATASLGGQATALGRDRALGQAVAALGGSALTAGVKRVLGAAAAALGFTAPASGISAPPFTDTTPPERTLTVEAETRLLPVPAETRVLTVEPEDRVTVIPPENRTLEA